MSNVLPIGVQASDTWGSLEEFAKWYISAGFPMLPPVGFQTFRTDDAVAVCTFRRAPYQVELYVINDPCAVPPHEHPYVEVIQYAFNKGETSAPFATPYQLGPKLTLGHSHGAVGADGRDNDGNGLLYTFEKWPDGVTPSTVSAVWKGRVVGPRHEGLIRRFFPDAYIVDGFADITRTMGKE